MNVNLAKRYPPREIFDREDTEFTPWLEENINYLGDELGVSLTIVEREKNTPTGLSVDLYVEMEDGDREGIIECQIEQSDHDHLGKLLTYLSTFESELAIWIVREVRYEHKKTIEWLNEATDKLFYLVKVEAVEVDGAKAPLFTPISAPSEIAKEVGESIQEPSDRDLTQERFWDELFERTPDDFNLFQNISSKQQGWISKAAPRPGVKYRYRVRNNWCDAGLYIDTSDRDLNEEIFDTLLERRDEIENDLPFDIEWQRLEDSRASRISRRIDSSGLTDEENWDEIQREMIESMQYIQSSFSGPISDLEV